MTVAELVEFLQKQRQDIPVVYHLYSEYALLEKEHIQIRMLCHPRNDGWVHEYRPDKPCQEYLMFPGN